MMRMGLQTNSWLIYLCLMIAVIIVLPSHAYALSVSCSIFPDVRITLQWVPYLILGLAWFLFAPRQVWQSLFHRNVIIFIAVPLLYSLIYVEIHDPNGCVRSMYQETWRYVPREIWSMIYVYTLQLLHVLVWWVYQYRLVITVMPSLRRLKPNSAVHLSQIVFSLLIVMSILSGLVYSYLTYFYLDYITWPVQFYEWG